MQTSLSNVRDNRFEFFQRYGRKFSWTKNPTSIKVLQTILIKIELDEINAKN